MFLTILLQQIVGSVNVDRHLHYLVPVHGWSRRCGTLRVGEERDVLDEELPEE